MVYRTTPKMAKRKLERRQKLLRMAVGIFGMRGYHQTTVPMIVAVDHGERHLLGSNRQRRLRFREPHPRFD